MSVMSRKMPRTLLGLPLNLSVRSPPQHGEHLAVGRDKLPLFPSAFKRLIQVLPRLGRPCITSCTVHFDNSMAEYPRSSLNDGLTT